MRWEMEMEEIEAVLETIWELHDKISDAILSISRSHFLNSIGTKSTTKKTTTKRNLFDSNEDGNKNNRKNGFVFVKDFRNADNDDDDVDDDEVDVDVEAMAEARSFYGIRTALENLEDHLEFFHTIQSQQRAEQDAALARLEQSRIVLAMRLAHHQGKKNKVIEEALSFVGDVHDAIRFVPPEKVYEEDDKGKRLSVVIRMFISSLALAKNCVKIEKFGGNAALFAVSVLAFLQLHQVAFRAPQLQDQNFYNKMIERTTSESDSSSSHLSRFDVYSARG